MNASLHVGHKNVWFKPFIFKNGFNIRDATVKKIKSGDLRKKIGRFEKKIRRKIGRIVSVQKRYRLLKEETKQTATQVFVSTNKQ